MAKTGAVWGIDIGQSALKALRCRTHEKESNRLVVEAFDYIEYPKLLSQPDADREELIQEALATFVSRNELKGDEIAMSVAGQTGLARFIKLPPVEAKKIPDIVKYEARQQIPFALEDVVWDYQALKGGSQDEGFALETEVGLFAMKRDQVARSIEPYTKAGIGIDTIQLAPLAVYNWLAFDRLGNLEGAESFDPENPPPSTVVLSIGTDTTDLVITNGFRVWQRNIPIGGSHFTKALTKELKLTFSKAEELKRNATKSKDPKAVFQAMRPVFSDLVAEVQRSIGFFTSNNRGAELKEVVAVGNAMKLPGLTRYLVQNLDIPVEAIEDFPALAGGSVTAVPEFEQNRLSFPVAYGLCVQGLGLSQISTNLLPQEIVTQRLIRAKKPWAVAAAALMMGAMTFSYAQYVSAWRTVDLENDWSQQINTAQGVARQANTLSGTNETLKTQFDDINKISDSLLSNIDGRLLWLELLRALDAAIPRDERPVEEREATAEDVTQREEILITSMDCERFEDLGDWFKQVQSQYEDSKRSQREWQESLPKPEPEAPAEGEEVAEDETAAFPEEESLAGEAEADSGPTGPGWVIQLEGHHFHNDGGVNEGEQFVIRTLLTKLEEGGFMLPDGIDGELVEVSFKQFGISHPVVVTENKIVTVQYDPNAVSEEDTQGRGSSRSSRGGFRSPRGGNPRGNDELEQPEIWTLRRYDFIVQFAWADTPRYQRLKNAEEAAPDADDQFAGVNP
ncbi:Competence protein A [Pseudobythopirellula maris]|uniref:Competence protein A n=1 Tax=Pseudobythopirellula maris TaxID=2527991 RepID=A0A5C5ZWM9_9BACT|nr:type IV pilus assembly protein PilM [Pseudobythopirellula maris]TWT90683.1 Competence protein A [Pseudobythopirellula maris]